jgi:phage major head subunit gpT-like protein
MAGTLTPSGAVGKWSAATITWNTLFREVLAGTATDYEKLATVMPSDTREEDYAWLDRIPAMREWIGPRQVNSLSARMQVLVNKLFENTVAVKRTDIDDDKIGVYRPIMEELARQAAELPDTLVSNALKAGTSALVYDNQYFFDTDHPVNMDDASVTGPGGSAVQANLLTGSALTGPNLKTAIQTMKSWVGADGKPMRIRPDTLVVPPELEFEARQLLNSQFIATDLLLGGGTHGATVQDNVLRGTLDLVVWPFLADRPTDWYVLCTKRAIKPLIFQNREAAEFAALSKPEDHNVFNFDEYMYGARARCVAGYGPWFLALKSEA